MLPLNLNGLKAEGMPFVNLDQYSGLWAIEEQAGMSLWQLVTSLNLAAHVQNSAPNQAAVLTRATISELAAGYLGQGIAGQVGTGHVAAAQGMLAAAKKSGSGSSSGRKSDAGDAQIAVIEIRGAMTKQGSSLSDAGSMVRIRQAMRQCRADDSIDGVMVIIDSPGGTVSGTAELADEYAALSAAKPTLTFVEDQMASAALWVGSQGRKVIANSEHSTVGSKGVLFALYDLSAQAAKEGIRPVVIRTGELKGGGFPGSEITDEQKSNWQDLVNQTNASFDRAMSVRKLTPQAIQDLSRGGMVSAKSAVGMGLIDGIQSFDGALSELRSMISEKGSNQRRKNMTDVSTSAAASFTELEAACRGADESFLVNQIRQGASALTAQANWMQALTARNGELNAKLKELEALSGNHVKLKAEHEELVKKLATSEESVKSLTSQLAEANTQISALKKGSGYKPVADTGGPNGKPAKKGKTPGKNGDADPDEDDDNDGGGTSASDQWNSKLNALVKKGKSRMAAVEQLARQEPELHAAYVDEANAGRRVSV